MLNHSRSSLNRIADRRVLVPTIGFCVAAGGLPFVVAVVLSFSFVGANGSFYFGSLEGYEAVLAAGRIREFVNILVRAATVTTVTMLFSIPAAYWLAGLRRLRLQTFVLAVLITPWLVSDMLRAFGWQLLLSPTGPVSNCWSFLTGFGPLEGLRYNFTAVIVGLVSAMLPAGVLCVFAAIPHRSRTEWLAATELGRPRHVFGLMGLGRAKPGIILGVCIVFVLSCFASAEPRFLDGPTQTSVQTVAASLVNTGVPALLAFGTLLVLFVMLSCIVAGTVYRILARRRRAYSEYPRRRPPPLSVSVYSINGRWIGCVTARTLDVCARIIPPLACIAAIALCCVPLTTVTAQAFWQPSPSGGCWTLENFQLMLASEQLVDALINSALVAMGVSFITAVLGFVLSLVVWDNALQRWVLLLIAFLVILPGDAYAISLIQLLKLFGHAEGGWTLVIIAHVLWALPFAAGTLMLANRHINEHVLEAGLEYSSGPLAVVLRVIGRLNIGRIAGVALLAGTLSLNEYLRSSYLAGGLLTLSNEVHGRLTAGLLPQNRGVFAAELLVFATSIATVIVMLAVVQTRQVSVNVDD